MEARKVYKTVSPKPSHAFGALAVHDPALCAAHGTSCVFGKIEIIGCRRGEAQKLVFCDSLQFDGRAMEDSCTKS